MLINSQNEGEINDKNGEIEHLKELVNQLIQDNDRLSEVLEAFKRNSNENSNEIELIKQKYEEKCKKYDEKCEKWQEKYAEICDENEG